MDVDIVDADGTQVPINRLMLHHIVFANLGQHDRPASATAPATPSRCSTPAARCPASAERFYAAGEERAKLRLPQGYGYPIKADDRWGMTWMLMNHRNRADTRLHPVQGDLRHRAADAGHALLAGRQELPRPTRSSTSPAAGKRGSTHTRSATGRCPSRAGSWPASATCTAGPRSLDPEPPGDCDALRSKPTWGLREPSVLQRQAGAARARAGQHERLHQRRRASAVQRGEQIAPGLQLRRRAAAHPRDGDHGGLPAPGTPTARSRPRAARARRICATGPRRARAGQAAALHGAR